MTADYEAKARARAAQAAQRDQEMAADLRQRIAVRDYWRAEAIQAQRESTTIALANAEREAADAERIYARSAYEGNQFWINAATRMMSEADAKIMQLRDKLDALRE